MNKRVIAWFLTVLGVAIGVVFRGHAPIFVLDAAVYGGAALIIHWVISL